MEELTIHDVDVASNGDFYKFDQGDNTLRMVSNFATVKKYYDDGESLRYACWAIDRRDGKIKFAELTNTVIKGIKILATGADTKFDSLPQYDFIVNKTGEKLETRYTIRGTRDDIPLTPEEESAISELPKIAEVAKKISDAAEKKYYESKLPASSADAVREQWGTKEETKVDEVMNAI